MALFPRRTKFRRIPDDRSRPVPAEPAELVTPPDKRVARHLITALFLAAGAVILNLRAGPQLKAGEPAAREYRARVTFQIEDRDATRRAREAAMAACPQVFRENREQLDQLPRDLRRFLTSVLDARRGADLTDLAPSAQAKWGLSSEKLSRLQAGFDRKWLLSSIGIIETAINSAADLGIMNRSDRKKELASQRDEIVVVKGDSETQPELRRSVFATREYPAGVRDWFAEQLDPVLKDRPESFRPVLLDMLTYSATATLTPDPARTNQAIERARDSVATRYDEIAQDSVIVAAGDLVTQETMAEIQAEREAYAASVAHGAQREAEAKQFRHQLLSAGGITALFLIGFALLAGRAAFIPSGALTSNTRLFGFYALWLATLGIIRLLEPLGLSLQWSPVALAGMIFAVTMGPAGAFGALLLLSLLAGLTTESGMSLTVPLLLSASAAVFSVLRLKRRTHLFEAGVLAGVMQLAGVWVMWCIRPPQGQVLWSDLRLPLEESLAAVGSGVLAGAVMTAALPYIEKFFDVATDLRLREWTDQNQPLLRKLAFEAPGTYHHSTLVSNMAEAAAGQTGANALLARVGGYLHDVGKINRPEYFGENAGGQTSRHEKLSPMLSALILTAHTKDGVELAAQYGVPSPIRHIIAEHHGTGVVEFFYQKAVKEAERCGGAVREEIFRYRGLKPRSPESAIVMLADASESAARSMDSTSPSGIERLVHDIVEQRLKDGQLDECRMNITDIRRVEKSLVRSLTAIAHPRIRYPSSPT
jgi:putative nucleotidyltransferase with HDIG domain